MRFPVLKEDSDIVEIEVKDHCISSLVCRHYVYITYKDGRVERDILFSPDVGRLLARYDYEHSHYEREWPDMSAFAIPKPRKPVILFKV